MRPLLVVTGPGPLWASQVPARHSIRYKPRPDLFGQFARAAALRYAGAVDRWIIWNEPNLPLWLQPQNTCKGRRCTPYAPHLYRRLVRAAYPAIKAVDPTSTRALRRAGAPRREPDQAERQDATAGLHPLAGLRQGHAQARPQRALQGLQAAHRRRPGLPPPRHHARAQSGAGDLDNASIGDLPRLERTLDATQRAGGLKKPGGGKFGLYFTEWGYQTRPPDQTRGVSLAKQSRYLQQGAYIAYKDPRVKLLTQYEWRDERIRRGRGDRYSGWQSGLRFVSDKAKPSLATFANPFFVDQRPGSRAPDSGGRCARTGTTSRWSAAAPAASAGRRSGPATNGAGYWKLTQTVKATTDYRFSWQPTDEYGARGAGKPATCCARRSLRAGEAAPGDRRVVLVESGRPRPRARRGARASSPSRPRSRPARRRPRRPARRRARPSCRAA